MPHCHHCQKPVNIQELPGETDHSDLYCHNCMDAWERSGCLPSEAELKAEQNAEDKAFDDYYNRPPQITPSDVPGLTFDDILF